MIETWKAYDAPCWLCDPCILSVDSEYEKIPSPQRRVIVIMDDGKDDKDKDQHQNKDMEDWDMLEDDETPCANADIVNAPTFAEVVIARVSSA